MIRLIKSSMFARVKAFKFPVYGGPCPCHPYIESTNSDNYVTGWIDILRELCVLHRPSVPMKNSTQSTMSGSTFNQTLGTAPFQSETTSNTTLCSELY